MRHTSVSSIAFVLALLLIGTTPMGTGSGVHQFDLIHPLFAHVHLVDGRIVTHEQLRLQQGVTSMPRALGAAFNTEGGLATGDGGVGLSPTLPLQPTLDVWASSFAWPPAEMLVPRGREEAPPDPPPLP
jgi:hypothetical protein